MSEYEIFQGFTLKQIAMYVALQRGSCARCAFLCEFYIKMCLVFSSLYRCIYRAILFCVFGLALYDVTVLYPFCLALQRDCRHKLALRYNLVQCFKW